MTLPPLTDEQRTALGRNALLACVAAGLLLPLDRPESSHAIAGELLPAPPIGGSFQLPPLRRARIVVHRDPFASEALDSAMTPAPGNETNLVLPPNDAIDGDGQDASDSAPIAVRAVIAGPAAQALLEIAGHTRIVGIGGHIAGSQIVNIDLHGVTLADGRRLPIQRATP